MAYGLPRKNTMETILQCNHYEVQDPWELALLTETWYTNLTSIKLPFLEDIASGSLTRLKKCKTNQDVMLPSAEAIQLEREYEVRRLNNLKHEENTAEEVRFSLRERRVGLRRPLPPKC
uniref:Chromosome 4 open reading frame 36 n=1 Tax=Catagonus wagneri TaxID=51154 RepID=A0A8C3YQC1_9CETA